MPADRPRVFRLTSRPTALRVAAVVAVLAMALAAQPGPVSTAVAPTANPLAGGPWPHSTIATKANPELRNHLAASGTRRKALARIALTNAAPVNTFAQVLHIL